MRAAEVGTVASRNHAPGDGDLGIDPIPASHEFNGEEVTRGCWSKPRPSWFGGTSHQRAA